MEADFASAQTIGRGLPGDQERYVLAGARPTARFVPALPSHVRKAEAPLVRVYDGFTRLFRVFVRGLYLCPALIVVRAVLYGMGSPLGDYVTLGFVLFVVSFFALFAGVVFLLALVGPKDQRDGRATRIFAPPAAGDVDRVLADFVPPGGLRVVGRLDAGLEPGTPVLVESWGASGANLARVFAGRSFVVVPDSGPPVAVDLAATPALFAPYEPTAPPPLAPTLLEEPFEPRLGCTFRQGERVELVAESAQPAVRLEDGRLASLLASAAPTSPYREAEATALVVHARPGCRIAVRRAGFGAALQPGQPVSSPS